ncbi:hypothetical protein KL918_004434 [Ogataea parapolymorpha]|nr:hypothetical protein KL918_004434 [Ogataea parapolymorpha]KAG7873574.1 hypothetical protein KL916_002178 [Ogataea parapolymorpha]KAG7879668.1 hypothetical protein KL938_003721 [Ogataea parapolymorpha]
MAQKINIPDLRFEQVFRRNLLNYAKQRKGAHATDADPLPIITPSLVLYTIIKDQVLMPFVQGFAVAFGLMLLRPWIRKTYEAGRLVGVRLVTSIGNVTATLKPYK